MSARCAAQIVYNNTGNQQIDGKVLYLPNKMTVQSALSGMSYIILFGADTAKLSLQAGNHVDCSLL